MSVSRDSSTWGRVLGVVAWAVAAIITTSPTRAQLCNTYYADARASALVPPSQSEAHAVVSGQFLGSCSSCPDHPGEPLTIQVTAATGFTASPTVVRVHTGTATENGPLLYEWAIPQDDPTRAFQVDFEPAHCAALDDTLLYVVLATAAHPEGEARGRIVLEVASPIETMTWGRLRAIFR